MRWVLDHSPAVRKALSEGRCCLGTVDTWLLWVSFVIYHVSFVPLYLIFLVRYSNLYVFILLLNCKSFIYVLKSKVLNNIPSYPWRINHGQKVVDHRSAKNRRELPGYTCWETCVSSLWQKEQNDHCTNLQWNVFCLAMAICQHLSGR